MNDLRYTARDTDVTTGEDLDVFLLEVPDDSTPLPKRRRIEIRGEEFPVDRAPSYKLPTFDDTKSIDWFLDRFKDVALFYGWTEQRQFYLMKSRIEGAAGDLVWSQKPADLHELISILRTSYGSDSMVE